MADKPWEMFEAPHEEMIKKSAAKYGADPKLLRATAKVESNFNPKAKSKAGAQGFMQLMPRTAKSLGVKDPFDMAQSIDGAAKLQGQLNTKYKGDRAKVAAAYNAGEGAVDRAGGIPDIPETQDYVKKIDAEYQAQGGSKPWEMFADNSGELKRQHEINLAAGREAERSGSMDTAAAAVSGAAPAVAAMMSLTPAAPAAPLVYGGGEWLRQELQKLGGSRQAINPYPIVGETALGAIPWPDVAMKLAARTPYPKTIFGLLKGPEGFLQGAANTAASHGIGALTSGLPGAEGGESPPINPEELLTSGKWGAAISMLGGMARIHSVTRQANDLNYKTASDQLYKGIGMPQRGQKAEFMGKTFDSWLPIMHEYAKTKGLKVDKLDQLRTATDKLKDDFYQDAYTPLVAPIREHQVSTQPIYDALHNDLMSNRKLMVENPGLYETLMKKVEAYKGATTSVDDLLKLRESYNKATKPLMGKVNMAQDFNASTANQADLTINKAIRETLNNYVEKYYGGDANVREILKNERDIITMKEHVQQASQTWDAMKRTEAGTRAKVLNKVVKAVSRSSTKGGAHSLAGSAISEGHQWWNNPDQLVASAFKRLDRAPSSYQFPEPPKGRVPMSVTAMQPGQQQGGAQTAAPSNNPQLKGGPSLPALPKHTASEGEFF